MTSENKNMMTLKKAFIDALNEKYREELSARNNVITCSAEHKRRIRRIINGSPIVSSRNRKGKKILIALLIAAILLLTGCGIYITRKQVGDFFMVFRNGNIEGYFQAHDYDPNAVISDIYTIGRLPDGYKEEKTYRLEQHIETRWKNELGDEIVFFQKIYNSSSAYFINGEQGEESVLHINDVTIYVRRFDRYDIYIWGNGVYVFKIATSYDFSDDEMTDLINSITGK